jgi:hypothetical protein
VALVTLASHHQTALTTRYAAYLVSPAASCCRVWGWGNRAGLPSSSMELQAALVA